MKFLANENFPLFSVRHLRDKGYNISSISEDSPGTTDHQVLSRAIEENRIILIFDRDYGELVYRLKQTPPLGVVYLRFIPETPAEPGTYLEELIQSKEIALQGNFTVIERTKIRQRPLP